ncbi:MAG: tetratricopeptide repeat protein [Gemmatimonadota bacterium]|nr:MAG: tetratricopeptide repeat protein [Gemmatimonadota bacterium]
MALAMCLVAAADLSAQASFFDEGNRLYQEGQFEAALESYLRIEQQGLESGALYFNIANAYFKLGDLGHSILYYERARRLLPRDEDVLSNLELARSLTADEITPLPGFWLFRAVTWWVRLLPTGSLRVVVAISYVMVMGGIVALVLRRSTSLAAAARGMTVIGLALVVIFGINLLVRELEIGQPEEAVVIVEEVEIRSAPSDDAALTVFEIHEGTKVRIDRRADDWLEVLLEDGKVGWLRAEAVEVI